MTYNLCCIDNELAQKKIGFKTMTWSQFNKLRQQNEDQALETLGSRWLNNVQVTAQIIKRCEANGWGYRVSSSLFPCLTHPQFDYFYSQVPQWKQIKKEFDHIAFFNHDPKTGGQKVRLSIHPDQFNVLASENEDAVKKTITELNFHGWLMDMLGCEKSPQNPINIHINRSTGLPLKDIVHIFIDNLLRCHESVTHRLTVENEDKGIWNVRNLMYIAATYKVPVTFDTLHNQCLPSEKLTEKEAIELCSATWGKFRPLFHYSESDLTSKNPRTHAEMPVGTPPKADVDWDIELKAKCFAIKRIEQIDLISKG